VIGRLSFSFANSVSVYRGIEIQGTEGSLVVSDISDSNGQICISKKTSKEWDHTEGDPSTKYASGVDWSLGIFELARAVRKNQSPVHSAKLAYKVLAVMLAIKQAALEKREIVITRKF